jgi:hypothetical protein
MGCGDVDWTQMVVDRMQWYALVNVAVNLRFP